MRILSWNINGIRTLPQYHPWNALKTGEAILNELKADIICFQEMKMQRTALEKHIAVPGRFESFFSFPVAKGGYSGVAVYTDTDTVAPLKAEEGLTGMLQPKPPLTSDERISPSYPQAHEMELFPDENEQTPMSLTALDAEGRALVVDFGLFVLINVYCPAETSDTRLPYKMNFHLILEERVRKLIREGREVIVLGDINVAAAPIDHCEGNLPSRQETFWDHSPRAWLKKWLAPHGPMIDVIRDTWPERKGMYTCWNNLIAGRDVNYGSRIDYVFLTQGLLPWFKHGDIQASIRGSDHCPVYIDLHEEIQLESGQTLKLRDVMKLDQAKRSPPRLSARFWNEFSGKQQLLSTFFTRKSENALSSSENLISPSQESTQPIQLTQESVADVASIQFESPRELSSIMPASSPLPISEAPPLSNGASLEHKASMPKKKNKRDDDIQPGGARKKKRKIGQTKLSSFFTKPSPATSSSHLSRSQSGSEPTVIDFDIDEADSTLHNGDHDQMEADYILARSLSESTDLVSAVTQTPSSSQSKATWSQILAPLQPPKCKVHGELCKEFTVNKSGPNKGKAFFVCSLPVGPGYDKGRSERLREEVDPQYRCDFFKWASEVKKESLRESGQGVKEGSSPFGSSGGEIESALSPSLRGS